MLPIHKSIFRIFCILRFYRKLFLTCIRFLSLWLIFLLCCMLPYAPLITVLICLAYINLRITSLEVCDVIFTITYIFVNWYNVFTYPTIGGQRYTFYIRSSWNWGTNCPLFIIICDVSDASSRVFFNAFYGGT